MPETPDLTLLAGAERLAELLPHRLIWLPNHTALRFSLDGQHTTGGLCADIFLNIPAHHGVLQWAIQQECTARGWTMGIDLHPHPKHPHARVVIYTPRFTAGSAPDLTLATVRAMINALEAAARYEEVPA